MEESNRNHWIIKWVLGSQDEEEWYWRYWERINWGYEMKGKKFLCEITTTDEQDLEYLKELEESDDIEKVKIIKVI